MIASIGETEVDSLRLAKSLRSKNLNVDLDLTDRKLDKKIKSADKKGVKQVIIVGEDEVKNQAYIVKNLETGAEQKLKVEDIKFDGPAELIEIMGEEMDRKFLEKVKSVSISPDIVAKHKNIS